MGRDMALAARVAASGIVFTSGLRRELRDSGVLLAVVAGYVALVFMVAQLTGLPTHFNLYLYSDVARASAGMSLFVFLIGYIVHLAVIERQSRPLRRISSDFRAHILNPGNLASVAVPLCAIPIFVSAFTSFKSMIPQINPFALDPLFARMDQALHLGFHPWELTHAIFGSPAASLVINFFYNAWFFIMWGFLLWFTLDLRRRDLRQQFLLSFMLLWVLLGSVTALALSSAGPVYYGRVTGLEDIFAPLMDRLAEIDAPFAERDSFWRIHALNIQQMLYDKYTATMTGIGAGISAMPSMHVAIAVLLALAARRLNRWFGRAMIFYVVMIQIGSVHLGWHYAIDGYLSIILTLGVWKLADWLVRQSHGTTAAASR